MVLPSSHIQSGSSSSSSNSNSSGMSSSTTRSCYSTDDPVLARLGSAGMCVQRLGGRSAGGLTGSYRSPHWCTVDRDPQGRRARPCRWAVRPLLEGGVLSFCSSAQQFSACLLGGGGGDR